MSPLDDVLAVAGEWADVSALALARDAWEAPPWRIAVVGRTGVGKSALVNGLVPGAGRPIGLGGVTEQIAEVADGPVVWLDTPGIEDAEADQAWLAPLLGEVDGVVWVTDGLVPVTHTERAALARAWPPPSWLAVVASRRDRIDDSEQPDVLSRVRTLTARHAPVDVVLLDLRRFVPAWRPPLPTAMASPRRRRAAGAALATVSAALDQVQLPELSPGKALRTELREAVRRAEATALAELSGKVLPGRTDAVERFLQAWKAEVTVLRARCPEIAPPEPRRRLGAAWDRVRDGLEGLAGLRRELRRFAAEVASEAELHCEDAFSAADARASDRRTRLAAARAAAEEARRRLAIHAPGSVPG